MIIKWLKDREAKKKKYLEEKYIAQREKAKRSVSLARDEMLSKPCPLARTKCYENCVHFEEGYVNYIMHHSAYGWWKRTNPRCKLWG